MEINHQVNHGEKHPQHWRSCKLIVDPALKNGFYKVYRYDGHHFNMPVSKFNFGFLHLVVLGYLLNVITDTVAPDLNFLLTTHFFFCSHMSVLISLMYAISGSGLRGISCGYCPGSQNLSSLDQIQRH